MFLETIRDLRQIGVQLKIEGADAAISRVEDVAERLDKRTAAMMRYAAKLTLCSGEMTASDVDTLRNIGLTDREVHDVVMVTACFAFMNRLADGTGVTLQPAQYELAQAFFGQEALAEHLDWANPNSS